MAKIAVMGYGTVGSGVCEVMAENTESIARNAAQELDIKYILNLHDRPDSPFAHKFIKDFNIIEQDPEIDVVVETIGGVGAAYEYTRRCLLAGKSVVTSNKELVATKGHELIDIAREKNVNYLFEASVGGGIPIIRPITQCLAANKIDEIYGVLNGTTNYILTEMITCGTNFADALSQAQSLGFAEQNPSADVDGHDACRKICILSDLCFGRHVEPELIKTHGIRDVALEDVEYARRIGYKIKLLGRALRTGSDTISAYVAPHFVSKDNLLSNVDGVMNGIVVHGNAIGEAMFYGPGAGKRPTASAVVADVIDAVKHRDSRKYIVWEDVKEGYVTDSDSLKSRWYIRAGGSLANIGKSFGNVQFISYPGSAFDEYAFISDEMDGHEINRLTKSIEIRSIYRLLD